MRQHEMVFGFLFILSTIPFALAAPILVQEKYQTRDDMAHVSHDVITVLGKRGPEEVEKVIEDLFGASKKPAAGPSDAHTSPILALPGPDHESMNDVKAQGPNPALLPDHPDPLTEPLNPTPISYAYPESHSGSGSDSDSDYGWLFDSDGKPLVPIPSPTSTDSGSGYEMTEKHVPQAVPIPKPSTDDDFDWDYWSAIVNGRTPKRPRPGTSKDGDFDWALWTNIVNQPAPKQLKIGSSNEFGQGQLAHAPQPNLLPGFNLDDYIGLDDITPLEPSSVKGVDQTHEDHWHVVPVLPQPIRGPLNLGTPEPNPGESNPGPPNPGLPLRPWYESPEGPDKELAQGPLPLPFSLPNTDSIDHGLPADHQPLGTDSQSLDPEATAAARYAVKGKAKELRRIPGTARDIRPGYAV